MRTVRKQAYPWAVSGILLTAGVLGELPGALYSPPRPLPLGLPFYLLLVAGVLATTVGLGLLLARKVGLGVPILESWLAGQSVQLRMRAMLWESVLAGVGMGVMALLVLRVVFRVPIAGLASAAKVAVWKRVLGAYEAALEEELLFRLVLLSLLAWLFGKVWQGQDSRPGMRALWTANAIASIVFAVAHLSSVSAAAIALPGRVVTTSMAGVLFCYLYWKHGLEGAVVAHLTADMVLLVVGPTLLQACVSWLTKT
jgi:membrane protease YdiL (CAAX protease family)